MPKLITFKQLAKIKATTKEKLNKTKPLFLTLLGTQTVFMEKPQQKIAGENPYYERGETLSYFSQTIAKLLAEKPQDIANAKRKETAYDDSDAVSFRTESVIVLNGPDRDGKKVGNRIAESTILVIEALLKGKTTLNISAHSRGACEALLLMHELDRIKKALNQSEPKPLPEILLDSPCKYTKAAFQSLFPSFFEAANKTSTSLNASLKQALDNLSVNAFLIDPVPGDPPLLYWKDQRFYQKLPDFCSITNLILYRDERSGYFYPVCPEGVSPLELPGHHGTGSGNKYCQQSQTILKNDEQARLTDVQDLMLQKLLLATDAHSLADESFVVDHLDLNHPELDEIVKIFFSARDTKQRNELLIGTYKNIVEENEFYRRFENRHYAYCGSAYTPQHKRWFYNKTDKLVGLDAISTEQPGIINSEHARLILEQYIHLDEIDQLDSQKLIEKITTAIHNINLPIKPHSPKESSQDLNTLLQNQLNRPLFFHALSVIIDQLGRRYLSNELSQRQKAQLIDLIQQPFLEIEKILAEIELLSKTATEQGQVNIELQLASERKKILIECQSFLQAGLKAKVEAYYDSLSLSSQTCIDKLIKVKSLSSDFEKTKNELHTLLNQEKLEKPIKAIYEKLDKAVQAKSITEFAEHNQEQLKSELVQLLEAIEESQSKAEVKTRIGKLFNFVELSKLDKKENIFNIIDNIKNLYRLEENTKKFEALLGEYKLNFSSENITTHIERLKFAAASLYSLLLLEEPSTDINIFPEDIQSSLAREIIDKAITIGEIPPSFLVLQQTVKNLQHEISEKQKIESTQSALIEKQQELITSYKAAIQAHDIQHKKTLAEIELKHKNQLADEFSKYNEEKRSLEQNFLTTKNELHAQLVEQKQNSKKAIANAQAEHQAQMLSTADRHVQALAKAKLEYQQLMDSELSRHQQEVVELNASLTAAKVEYQQQLEKETVLHQKTLAEEHLKIQAISTEFQVKLASEVEQHKQSLQAQENSHKDALAKLKSKNEQLLNEKHNFQEQLTGKHQSLKLEQKSRLKIEETHKQELKVLKTEHHKVLAALTNKYEQKLAALSNKYQHILLTLQNTQQQLTAQNQKFQQQIKIQQDEIEQQHSQHKVLLKEVQQQLAMTTEHYQKEIQKHLARAKQYDTNEQVVNAKHKKQLDSTQKKLSQQEELLLQAKQKVTQLTPPPKNYLGMHHHYALLASSCQNKSIKVLYQQIARLNLRASKPSYADSIGTFFSYNTTRVSFKKKALQVNRAMTNLKNEIEILNALDNQNSKLYQALNLTTMSAVEKTQAIIEIEKNKSETITL